MGASIRSLSWGKGPRTDGNLHACGPDNDVLYLCQLILVLPNPTVYENGVSQDLSCPFSEMILSTDERIGAGKNTIPSLLISFFSFR